MEAKMFGSDLLNGQGRLSQCDIVRDSELLNLIKHIKPCSLIVTYFNENNIHFLLNLVASQVSLFASRFLFVVKKLISSLGESTTAGNTVSCIVRTIVVMCIDMKSNIYI